MHIAIGEQAEKVQGALVGIDRANHLLPRVAVKHPARGDRFVDQLGALIEDTSGPEGIVTHFAIADIRVARQTDRGPVGLEGGVESVGFQPGHRGSPSQSHGIAKTLVTYPNPIHHNR